VGLVLLTVFRNTVYMDSFECLALLVFFTSTLQPAGLHVSERRFVPAVIMQIGRASPLPRPERADVLAASAVVADW
jgi:hypothetical protein